MNGINARPGTCHHPGGTEHSCPSRLHRRAAARSWPSHHHGPSWAAGLCRDPRRPPDKHTTNSCARLQCQPVKTQCLYLPLTSPSREQGELLLREQYSHFKFHLKTIQFGEILCNTSLSFEKHCAAENTQTIGRRL